MDAWAKGLPSEKRRPREVRQQAKELLESFDVEGGEPFANILDKFPDEISGGARAIVRLVSALMEPRLRILVLDEAFSGIDQRIWITALERLRDRVNKNEIGILFVSHMAAERSRWQPTRRYRLEAGSLTQQPDVPGTTFTLQAPPRPERDIICFERNTASSNQIPEFLVSSFFKTPYAIIADSNVTSTESFLELRGALAAKTIGDLPLLEISVTESTKSLTQVELVLSFLASTIKQDEGTIFCVGGGTLLNSAGLAAALFLRGRVPTVYVPTTATAIADVAIGSKTGVNRQSGISHLKHLIGTHFDPSGIFLDSRYLNGQSRVTSVESLAEIVKHGIVQDEALLNEAIALCKQTKISPEDIYRLARSTLFLKQEVLLEDLPEKAIGRILQYGHLHAHSLERALAFEISHNRSVWCGIFLDLYLGGKCIETSVLKKLLDAVSTVIKEDLGGVQIPDDRTLRRAYELETKRETRGLDGGYQIVTIDSPGCYADPERKKISTMEVPWLDVAAAWSLLRS
jgi:3-dehydroquinate synthetase